ncbi:MAG: RNA polymerase sigma factor [Anaerotignum lactatifermentans]
MDFDQVYRAFFRDVLFYVWGLCGDRVLAEEIAQETFFKALKSIDRFDGQGDIRPWLFAISKNTYYDHCRTQKKTEPLEAEKDDIVKIS